MLFFSCQKNSGLENINEPQDYIKSIRQDNSAKNAIQDKISYYNELAQAVNVPSFQERWGIINFNVRFTATMRQEVAIFPISKNGELSHFLITDDDTNLYLISNTSQKDIINELRLPFYGDLVDLFLGFTIEDQNISAKDLPAGCYNLVGCVSCPEGWGFEEIDCSTLGGGSTGTGGSEGTEPDDTQGTSGHEGTGGHHNGNSGGGSPSGGYNGNDDGDLDAHTQYLEWLAMIGELKSQYGNELVYKSFNGPVIYVPVCEESFPYTEFPQNNSYYLELNAVNVSAASDSGVPISFCTPEVCIQIPIQNQFGTIPVALAQEYTAIAYDAAKVKLGQEIHKGNIIFNAQAELFFIQEFREQLAIQLDIFLGNVSINKTPCNPTGVQSSSLSYKVGPICINGITSCN